MRISVITTNENALHENTLHRCSLDQFFSRLAIYLRTHDSLCRADMLDAVNRCCESQWHTRARGLNLETVANISDWLTPRLADTKQIGKRDGIAKFRQFRFTRGADGEALMSVRTSCGDLSLAWRGLEENSLNHKVTTPFCSHADTHC
jgi:hypothetical protein